jgi:acyl-CoA thioesterase-2
MMRPDRFGDDDPRPRWIRESPIDMRACDPFEDTPREGTPRRRVWMRVKGTLPDDPTMHAAMLTFASDRGVLATARHTHDLSRGFGASASLDHTIWFHHPPRFDDWILYTSESPVAHAARALILGQMFRRDGTRVASVAQEGLIRAPRFAPPK